MSAFWLYLSLGLKESGQPERGTLVIVSFLVNVAVAWFVSKTGAGHRFVLSLNRLSQIWGQVQLAIFLLWRWFGWR